MPRSWPVIARVRRIGEMWAQSWRGEYDRSTLRSVPSWGMSFLLHALMLLLLAFVFHLRRSGESLALLIQPAVVDTQLGDVTSLVDATARAIPSRLTTVPTRLRWDWRRPTPISSWSASLRSRRCPSLLPRWRARCCRQA